MPSLMTGALRNPVVHCLAGSVMHTSKRSFSLSSCSSSVHNFKRFTLGNKRGTRIFKKERQAGKFPDLKIKTDVRPVGYNYGDKFVRVPEMIPELVVPDLKGCTLKPYVSYRTPLIVEDEFTPKDLFNVVYKAKIEADYEKGKLSEDGQPLEPSPPETLTAEEARMLARKTGSDLFTERKTEYWEFLKIKLT